MKPIPENLRQLYNNPNFWQGALAIREADLKAAGEAASGIGQWAQDAVGRTKTLLDATIEGSVDITTLPEFERWLTNGGMINSKTKPQVVDDLDIKELPT